jgi:hypothetical protein
VAAREGFLWELACERRLGSADPVRYGKVA